MNDFEQLYREYYTRVYLFLYKLCGEEQLAEDLTQETFYQAYTSFYRFQNRCDIFTWLAAIGKHTYFKFLRKNKLNIASISLDSVAETYRAHNCDNPEQKVEKEDVAQAIRSIVDKIPEKYRDVVILRIYADLSFAQVGKALKISENSARVIYFRAKKMLMEELQDEFNV